MNDWSLEPYRFPDPPDDPRRPARGRPGATEGQAGAVETFRADRPKPPGARRFSPAGWRWIAAAAAMSFLAAALVGLAGMIWLRQTYLDDIPPLPARDQLYAVNRSPGIKFYDRDGQLIAARGPRYGDRVRLGDLPAHVPQAFLAAEDRRFYRHGAIDLRAIVRAAYENWRAGQVVQGGSTLAQQLAKGLFLTPDQTLRRKLQEAVMAQRLERMLTKDEVLELYLNRIFFGANTFGVDGAARTYFGKSAGQLTLSEAALLAALPKAPSRLALNRDMAAALDRSHLVLDRMRRQGWISRAQMEAASAERPKLAPTALSAEGDFGYALDYATNEVLRRVGPHSPDLLVRLSIDPRLQAAGAGVLRRVLDAEGRTAGASQGAMVALGDDGAIRVMVGGRDYADSVFNRTVQSRRQPGSSFKPFIYAAALEKGVLPTDVRVDGPVRFGNWRPENYGGGYRGPVTVETALARSINTVAVKLAQEAGGRSIGDLVRRFGLTTIPANPDLSVALGAYEVSVLEMVSGFQVFQQGGVRLEPYMIEEIRTVDGRPVFTRAAGPPLQVYDVARASMMVKMMKRVITQGTGTRAAFGRPAAGKTGTSQNWRDAWFIGFTPDIVAGVWVGNDNDKPMNKVTGGVLSAEIWRRFMITAHQGLAVRDFAWLLPDPVPPSAPDPRNGFYETLAAEFARAQSAADDDLPPPDASREDDPEPEALPY